MTVEAGDTAAPPAVSGREAAPAGNEAVPALSDATPAENEGPTAAPAKRARRAHVHEIDVVRVLTFACVIAVHTVANVNPSAEVWPNSLLMLLHFTRSAFFALTGFVLTYQYLNRPLPVGSFWRRRITLVGVPYLTWSVLYTGLAQVDNPSASAWAFVRTLAENIVLGTAWYHLYFLLVSMQIYLLFPLLQQLVRRTAGHHAALSVGTFVLQAGILAALRYGAPPPGWAADLVSHSDAIIVTYIFYVVAGAIAAHHLSDMREFVPRHRGAILAIVIGVAALTELFFALEVVDGVRANTAATVLQPAMLPWSIVMTGGLFALGVLWSRGHAADSGQAKALRTASDRSFGVFLVHPAILWVILWLGDGWVVAHIPGPLATVLAYLVVIAGAIGFTELARHTRVSMPLTGRPSLQSIERARRPHAPAVHAPVAKP